MTIATGQQPGYNDPLYSQGMAHLQAGHWQEAIRCFEALVPQYPDDRAVEQALDEARFKAKLDATTKVRPKRVIFPWRKLIVRGMILVLVALVVFGGVRFFRDVIEPGMKAAAHQRQVDETVAQIGQLIVAESFDEADQKVAELLTLVPDHGEAAGFLSQIGEGRTRKAMYENAVALLAAGDLTGAQQNFLQLKEIYPDYKPADVEAALKQIDDRQNLAILFREGEASAQQGNCNTALTKLEEVRRRDLDYERVKVEKYLADCHLAVGLAIVLQESPEVSLLPEALDHFEQVLALRPKDAEAGLQRDLASRFLQGKERFDNGQFDRALPMLRSVYDLDPSYLGGLALTTLYDAYLGSGDGFWAAGNCNDAYEQFRKACQDLPVADTTLACSRFEQAVACVTPTSTPTATPTTTPTPTPTGTPRPTAPPPPTPTAIPASVLIQRYKGNILFRADKPGQEGWWVMAPDGSNQVYLGNASDLTAVYNDLREKETLSPDGACRTYTTQTGDDDWPAVYAQCRQVDDLAPPTWKISKGLTKVNYDPVWSPDGQRIAYVSQNKGSDDIWIARAEDGTEQWNLTPNTWEWDKHPSWGPDSQHIVFWSNREGTKQIFIIDANNLNDWRKVSATTWDEYDPIWIK